MARGQGPEVGKEPLVPAGQRHDLEVALHSQEALGEDLDGRDPRAARHQEQRHAPRVQAKLGRSRRPGVGLAEDGHDRDPRHPHGLARDAALGQPPGDLVVRREVAGHALMDPHGVDIEVGDLDPDGPVEGALRDLLREDLRRQEVGADDMVRGQLPHRAPELVRVQAFDRGPQPVHRRIGLLAIRPGVEVAPERGQALHDLDVRVRIRLPEQLRDQVHEVEVDRLHLGVPPRGGRLEGLGSPHVTSARRHAQDRNLLARAARHALTVPNRPMACP